MSEDELKKYHHFKIKTSDGIELDLIETKYYEELLDLYKKEKEKNEELLKDNNALNRLVYFNKNITFPYETELTRTNNYISKDKIREVLEKYKYTEIVDSTRIIAFYKAIQGLLEEN